MNKYKSKSKVIDIDTFGTNFFFGNTNCTHKFKRCKGSKSEGLSICINCGFNC